MELNIQATEFEFYPRGSARSLKVLGEETDILRIPFQESEPGVRCKRTENSKNCWQAVGSCHSRSAMNRRGDKPSFTETSHRAILMFNVDRSF